MSGDRRLLPSRPVPRSTSELGLRASDIPVVPLHVDDGEIADGYRGGRTINELARELGCSPATVYRRLEAAGVTRRPTPVAIEREALLEGLAAGLSAPAIATANGVSVTAVCRALAREDLLTASQVVKLNAAQHRRSPLSRSAGKASETSVTP